VLSGTPKRSVRLTETLPVTGPEGEGAVHLAGVRAREADVSEGLADVDVAEDADVVVEVLRDRALEAAVDVPLDGGVARVDADGAAASFTHWIVDSQVPA
jgi:hypothetical protein